MVSEDYIYVTALNLSNVLVQKYFQLHPVNCSNCINSLKFIARTILNEESSRG